MDLYLVKSLDRYLKISKLSTDRQDLSSKAPRQSLRIWDFTLCFCFKDFYVLEKRKPVLLNRLAMKLI